MVTSAGLVIDLISRHLMHAESRLLSAKVLINILTLERLPLVLEHVMGSRGVKDNGTFSYCESLAHPVCIPIMTLAYSVPLLQETSHPPVSSSLVEAFYVSSLVMDFHFSSNKTSFQYPWSLSTSFDTRDFAALSSLTMNNSSLVSL